jgi:signal transduction histidine kinase
LHAYLSIVAASVLAFAACAGAVYSQAVDRRTGMAASLALYACAYWGLCQLAMNLQPDPALALWLERASTAGWIFLGPLCLTVFVNVSGSREPWMDWTVGALAIVSAIGLAFALSTGSVIAGIQREDWGWAMVAGPWFAAASTGNLIAAAVAVAIGRRGRERRSAEENLRRGWIGLAIVVPIVAVLVSDVLLPMRGIHLPRAAPAVFAPVALLGIWLRVRIGHSPLAPGEVANEILEILPDGVALLGRDERIRIANPFLARLCGCTVEELAGVAIGERLVWNPEQPDVAELREADGKLLPVSVSSAPLLDATGSALGRVLVVRDLREVADLRRQLLTSARLAAVGELAAGIAHEINNPLAFVRSNLSQLEEIWKQLRPAEAATDENAWMVRDLDDLFVESIEGVDRAAEIVRSVKSFAHAGSASREPTDLHPLLEDVLHVASAQLRSRVNVQREFDEALPRVVCAPQQLRSVFLNLVVNAAQAVETGGHVLVATRTDGDHVVVSVADDGCGIPAELIERIFDPFFTTKAVGEGTGLGLAIAHQIVTSHGGEIQVESSPGRGTVFRVRLPAASA